MLLVVPEKTPVGMVGNKLRRILLLKKQYQDALEAGDMSLIMKLQKEAGKI